MNLVTYPPPKIIVFLAGSNGAGKSTFYRRFLEDTAFPFINADAILASAIQAGEIRDARWAMQEAESQRAKLTKAGASFITETVFSDPVGAKLLMLRKAQENGYFLECIFIGISSSQLSRARVIQRVTAGGHDVPDDKIDARFPRTLANLAQLITIADRLTLYDNSSAETPFRQVAVFENGMLLTLSSDLPGWTADLDLLARKTPSTSLIP